MSEATNLVGAQLKLEEGKRRRAYNDATGATVTCKPQGNLSIGYGINLEVGLDDEEILWLLDHRLGLVEKTLLTTWWYPKLDPVRQSVFLDVGYNIGVDGLLHFPKCIAAAGAGRWQEAHDELLDSAAARQLPKRYSALATRLLTGVLS